jgi:hypothetical protein
VIELDVEIAHGLEHEPTWRRHQGPRTDDELSLRHAVLVARPVVRIAKNLTQGGLDRVTVMPVAGFDTGVEKDGAVPRANGWSCHRILVSLKVLVARVLVD